MSDPKEALQFPLFRALADISFDSVMVTEAANDHKDSVVVYVNEAFKELTGYSAEEVLGKTPGLLQGPETEKAVTDRLADDLKNHRTFHGSTTNYRKDGSPFTIEWTVTPVLDEGKVTHYVAVPLCVKVVVA
ncbi:PAS domain-containing protein [Vreelandella utahensis]|uniref:PAS domain-containing protein n=1 Tax=Vreelandella halophila TaxID=86177 RepID=UPI0009873475|nr:PAS domain S-box protein [Halomonas utahensis]